jgi:AcrR family transcriptional regulator
LSGKIMDRRVQKTRKLLQDALVDLISQKGFESITIQEILDRANVGRSTFYIHFQNKNELLHSCFDELGKLFERDNKQLFENDHSPGDDNKSDFILNLFRFVGQNHRLFKALFGKQGIAIFNSPIYDYMSVYIFEALQVKSQDKRASLQTEIVANYLTSALIGTVRWWVEQDIPYPAQDMEKLFKKLSVTGFKNVVS